MPWWVGLIAAAAAVLAVWGDGRAERARRRGDRQKMEGEDTMTEDINRVIAEWLAAHGHPELAWEAVVSHAWCKKLDRLDETHWNPPVIIVETGVYRCGVTGPTWICNGEIDPQDVELIPNNFVAPAPLLAAVEEYAKGFVIFRVDTYRARYDGEWNGFLGVDYGNSDGDRKGRVTYPARGASYCEALRAALAAAIAAEKGEAI